MCDVDLVVNSRLPSHIFLISFQSDARVVCRRGGEERKKKRKRRRRATEEHFIFLHATSRLLTFLAFWIFPLSSYFSVYSSRNLPNSSSSILWNHMIPSSSRIHQKLSPYPNHMKTCETKLCARLFCLISCPQLLLLFSFCFPIECVNSSSFVALFTPPQSFFCVQRNESIEQSLRSLRFLHCFSEKVK